jgi:hypothetical protein
LRDEEGERSDVRSIEEEEGCVSSHLSKVNKKRQVASTKMNGMKHQEEQ